MPRTSGLGADHPALRELDAFRVRRDHAAWTSTCAGIASLVADVYRILIRGGVFIYPRRGGAFVYVVRNESDALGAPGAVAHRRLAVSKSRFGPKAPGTRSRPRSIIRTPHRGGIVERSLNARVAQVESVLPEVHPQLSFDADRRSSNSTFSRIIALDDSAEALPRDRLVHLTKKLRSPGGLFRSGQSRSLQSSSACSLRQYSITQPTRVIRASSTSSRWLAQRGSYPPSGLAEARPARTAPRDSGARLRTNSLGACSRR
jgi:hypothetical protein